MASKDKGEKGKGKSPAPGKKSPARGTSPRSRSKLNVADSTSEVPETLSEEDAKKKLLAHNTKKDYKTAVANEGEMNLFCLILYMHSCVGVFRLLRT